MAAKRTRPIPESSNQLASAFAGMWGRDRQGARIRAAVLSPSATGVSEREDEALVHPIIDMAIGGGGQGGEVRLKLWLSLLYRTIKTEDWIKLRPVEHVLYARMFGLDDPNGKGADRIRAAYRWLHRHRFIVIEGGRLKPYGRVRVAHEFAQFTPEGSPMVMRPSPTGKKDGIELEGHPNIRHRYFSVPRALWENGWIEHLRAPELVVLMILCDAERGRVNAKIEIPIHSRLRNYGLSDEMWRQGENGLERRGIIERLKTKGRRHDGHSWGHDADAARVYGFVGANSQGAMAKAYDQGAQALIRREIVQ